MNKSYLLFEFNKPDQTVKRCKRRLDLPNIVVVNTLTRRIAVVLPLLLVMSSLFVVWRAGWGRGSVNHVRDYTFCAGPLLSLMRYTLFTVIGDVIQITPQLVLIHAHHHISCSCFTEESIPQPPDVRCPLQFRTYCIPCYAWIYKTVFLFCLILLSIIY